MVVGLRAMDTGGAIAGRAIASRAIVYRWWIVVQGRQRQAIRVIEIAFPEPVHEEEQAGCHQTEADEHQENHDIHVSLLPVRRQAVRLTMPTELTGMRIAATTGVTRPMKHRPTTERL